MLIFCDSFDHYATADVLQKWTAFDSLGTAQAISSGGGRRGSNGWTCTTTLRGIQRAIAASGTVIVGVAATFPTLPASVTTFINLLETATSHVQLRLNSDGSLTLARNTTGLGTSAAGVISAATFNYIEVRATVHDSTGAYEVRVNGANVLSATGVDTRNGGASGVVNLVSLTFPVANAIYDDFYICDTTGGANDDFLGDVRVDAYLPNGNGNSSQLVGSDADSTDNYLLVDESAPDGDTSYVQSSTATDKDTYAFANMAHTPSDIYGVQVVASAKKDDAGARSIATVVRSDGVDTDGATQALSTAYVMYREILEEDPDTSAPWLKAGFDAAEFGVKVAA